MEKQEERELVSVIIPSYNAIAWIGRAIESALVQTYRPLEIIVVDDGSTDGTYEHVRHTYPMVKVIRQPNGGVSAARNAGAEAAQGGILAFLDADDVWSPKMLELELKAANDFADWGMCGTGTAHIFKAGQPVPQFFHGEQQIKGVVPDFQTWLRESQFYTSSVLIKKDVFFQVGGFDINLRYCEDYDLWLRVAARWKTVKIDAPLLAYQITPDSLSHAKVPLELNRILTLATWGKSYPEIMPRVRKSVWSLTRKLLRNGRIGEACAFFADCRSVVTGPSWLRASRFAILVLICKLHCLLLHIRPGHAKKHL